MTISGTVTFNAEGFYNGKKIRDLSPEERERIRRHWMAKGAKEVIFKGIEPYFTKEIQP